MTRNWPVRATTAALAFATMTLLVITGCTAPLDSAVAEWFATHRPLWLLGGAGVLGVVTTPALVAAVGLAVLLVVWRHRLAAWLTVAAGVVAAFSAGWLVKLLVHRPRPPAGINLHPELESSYPSGHVVVLAVLVGSVILLRGRGRRAGAVIVTAVCLQRLVVGAHWVTDVAGALFLAAVIVALATAAPSQHLAYRAAALCSQHVQRLAPTRNPHKSDGSRRACGTRRIESGGRAARRCPAGATGQGSTVHR
jgi:membrane-associated phospholipid phosphatase